MTTRDEMKSYDDWKLGSPHEFRERIVPRSEQPPVVEPLTADEKLELIEHLCQKHAHPGCNTGAHRLACEILDVAQGRRLT